MFYSNVMTTLPFLCPAQNELQQKWKFETSQLTIRCCDRRRRDSYQNFIVPGSRFCYLSKLKYIWRTISYADNSFMTYLQNPSILLSSLLRYAGVFTNSVGSSVSSLVLLRKHITTFGSTQDDTTSGCFLLQPPGLGRSARPTRYPLPCSALVCHSLPSHSSSW
jgi:hypothetical protein